MCLIQQMLVDDGLSKIARYTYEVRDSSDPVLLTLDGTQHTVPKKIINSPI